MTRNRRIANNGLGGFVIALMFLAETFVADRANPNPLSPLVWSVLALVAVASLGVYAVYRARDRRDPAPNDA